MIRVILVDDEPLSLLRMERILNEFNTIEVVKSFLNTTELLNERQSLDFQVAFLDIEMPGLNGLELAETLKLWNPNIYIVFVTAYRDYAVQAFDVQSIDYLLKPISKSRLAITVDRITERIQLEHRNLPSSPPIAPSLKIKCFGGFTVYHNDKIINWRTVKTKELFAFLFSNLYNQVHRDTILNTIWAETEHQKARVQLHTTISYLRTILNSIGYDNVVRYANGSYILQLEDFESDVLVLEQLLQSIKEHDELNMDKVESFIQEYSGSYMDNMDYSWVAIKASFFNNQFAILLDYLVVKYSATRDLKKREETLLLTLQLNPYSDQTLQKLMQHYIEADNRTEAVKVFLVFQKNLLTDLGILPDLETMALFKSIMHE
ncbi:MAG: response regulator [Lysinibacillus sp.]